MFSLRRLALRAARQTSIASSARPLSTAFKPSTFTISSSRPKNLSELRSFESLLQIRYNSTDAPIDTPSQFTNPAHKSTEGADLTPAKTVYVGNVQFDATPETLGEEFKRFGEVRGAKIIYDSRGLSKGFGYVEFAEVEQAAEAIDKMHNEMFMGRRLIVQYVVKQASRIAASPESRTLFIGNLSFDVTDDDLNNLFKDIENCVDVRVAMDRATGEPRGFAHADFLDVESAVKAKEKLADAEVYGRRLRIDFSGNRREGGFNRGRRDDRQGGRSEYQQRDRQQGQFANHRSYTPRSEVPE
ncbi:RNA-binding domain-containing protein [Morchella conica CCBAS932]|uniref:RNA-binding domain-containing protein n=2 Tax=Morchella sect. Distantes TaxID=1051054 RepID=A0A3N4L3N1_9PEZI|nr:RNA-binding domain-containing protein [Morchella conica CCBAS932]